jgi:hypothetical protein
MLLLCRRDLTVLLLHAGQPAAAAAELAAYLDSVRRQPFGAQTGQDPFDVRLAQDLWKLLKESGVTPARYLWAGCLRTVLQWVCVVLQRQS